MMVSNRDRPCQMLNQGAAPTLNHHNQKESSFEVRELNGRKSDIPFSYRIVAKRRGYEEVRFAKEKEEMMTAMITSSTAGEEELRILGSVNPLEGFDQIRDNVA